MNEREVYLLDLSAADRALLAAVRKKMSADGNPEFRRILRSALAMPGAGARRKTSGGQTVSVKCGRLLVFPNREAALENDMQYKGAGAEMGEPPAL